MRGVFLSIGAALVAGGLMAQVPAQPSMGQMGQQAGRQMPGPNIPTQNPGMTNDTVRNKVDDKKFVKDAVMGGLTQVELGKLAAQKGSSDAVKQFGQQMVDDHTKANDELKSVASAQSFDIPASLDSKHQALVNKLSKLSGPAFDKAYTKNMVKDHEQDLREFQNEAQNGNNQAVKEFAGKALPILKEHLAMAKDMNNPKAATNSADRSQQ